MCIPMDGYCACVSLCACPWGRQGGYFVQVVWLSTNTLLPSKPAVPMFGPRVTAMGKHSFDSSGSGTSGLAVSDNVLCTALHTAPPIFGPHVLLSCSRPCLGHCAPLQCSFHALVCVCACAFVAILSSTGVSTHRSKSKWVAKCERICANDTGHLAVA